MRMLFKQKMSTKIGFLFSVVALLLAIKSHSQETTKAKVINDTIVGEAVYQYYINNQDTVFNGSYAFNSTKNIKGKEQVVSYNYEGNYAENQKTGKWVFSRKELTPQNKFKEKDYKTTFLTSGKEFKINANFKEGLADGDWQVVYQKFKSSQPTDTLYSINTKFKDAVMIDRLIAKSSRVNISGEFTDEGLLNGDWEIIHQIDNEKIIEIRTFEKGVFKSHYFLKNNQKYPIQHIGLDTTRVDDENWVDIKIRDQYFQIIELTNFGVESNETASFAKKLLATSQETNQFLKNALLSFGYFNDFEVWNSLRGNQAIVYGKFKVRKFPYSEKEKQQLDDIVSKTEAVDEILDQFFSNSQIEIGKLSFENLSLYESILKQYQKAHPKLNQFVAKISQPAFEYVIREEVFPNLNLEIDFTPQISYSYQEEAKTKEHSFPKVPNNKEYSIKAIYNFVEQLHKDVTEIEANVKQIVEDLSKQQALSEEEEELVAKKAELEALFNNETKDEDFNTYHENLATGVLEFADETFENYVKLPVDQKKDEIQTTLTCFDNLINAYTEIGDLPRKLQRIDDVYTRTSFNPYLMVDMSERIKERIYTAFEDYLFPSLMEEIKQQINCDEFLQKIQNLENIYNRMIRLSDQDTSALEKELRREKDVNEIKRILLK